jgi:hypothetical protein
MTETGEAPLRRQSTARLTIIVFKWTEDKSTTLARIAELPPCELFDDDAAAWAAAVSVFAWADVGPKGGVFWDANVDGRDVIPELIFNMSPPPSERPYTYWSPDEARRREVWAEWLKWSKADAKSLPALLLVMPAELVRGEWEDKDEEEDDDEEDVTGSKESTVDAGWVDGRNGTGVVLSAEWTVAAHRKSSIAHDSLSIGERDVQAGGEEIDEDDDDDGLLKPLPLPPCCE